MQKTIDNLGGITIEESDMRFGSYSKDDIFCIEENDLYKAMQSDGVKTAEFLLFKKKNNYPMILLIEAKKRAPKILNSVKIDKFIKAEKEKIVQSETELMSFFEVLEKRLKHDDFFNDIKGKFRDTIALFVAIRLNLHQKASVELSENFKQLPLSDIQFKFVLVIKEHKAEWLQDLQSKLETELRPILKIWNLTPTSVVVLNEEKAIKRGLVIRPVTNNTAI